MDSRITPNVPLLKLTILPAAVLVVVGSSGGRLLVTTFFSWQHPIAGLLLY